MVLAIKLRAGWYPVIHEEIWYVRNQVGSSARLTEWAEFWSDIALVALIIGVVVWAMVRRFFFVKQLGDHFVANVLFCAFSFGTLIFMLTLGVGLLEDELVHGENIIRTAIYAALEYSVAGAVWGAMFWLLDSRAPNQSAESTSA